MIAHLFIIRMLIVYYLALYSQFFSVFNNLIIIRVQLLFLDLK